MRVTIARGGRFALIHWRVRSRGHHDELGRRGRFRRAKFAGNAAQLGEVLGGSSNAFRQAVHEDRARWADVADIRKAGLTQPAGVFLGQHDGHYLRHEGPEHVLTFAPTRSGKGVGLVVPT